MVGLRRKAGLLTMALVLTAAAVRPAQAGPLNWVSNWLGGKAVRDYYENTGHTCTDKPWYVPLPTHLWYNFTCARTAR